VDSPGKKKMSKSPVEPPKGNILVVDDTPDNLRVLSSMLTKRGHTVRKALNGQSALTVCQTILPDLILLDINMPGMNEIGRAHV
jgi:CheY-like chemotaxis protein